MAFKLPSILVLDDGGNVIAFECVDGVVGSVVSGFVVINKKSTLVGAARVTGYSLENDEVAELVGFSAAGFNGTC